MAKKEIKVLIPDPHDVPTPEGAEGWEEMYPPHWLFGKDREEGESSKFWFQMSLQFPKVQYPIDTLRTYTLSQANSYGLAMLAIPTAYGIECRILNGYEYATLSDVTDPALIGERAAIFGERVRFLVDNWDEVWRRWVERNLKLIEEIEDIEWPELKIVEDWETGGSQARLFGKDVAPSGLKLLQRWNEFKNLVFENCYMHFELLEMALACYVLYREQCLKAFPDMEERDIAITLSGVEQPIMEGDLHLRELAELAVELGVQDVIKQSLKPEEILQELGKTDPGRKWLQSWDEAKFWFHMTDGNAMYHYHTCWLDDLSIPFRFLRSYISEVEEGKKVTIVRGEGATRAVRMFEEYRDLLPTEGDKRALTEVWEAARRTAIALEGHAFYSDHWMASSIFRKVRELGQYLEKYHILKEAADIRFLNMFEIEEVLHNLVMFWYVQSEPRTKPLWDKIERRKKIMEVLENYSPPMFLVGRKAKLPERITEPMMIGLWGLTSEKVEELINPPQEVKELKGWAASPGVCEGVARVVEDPVNEWGKIKEGDILVTSFLSPSQVAVFGKIKGLVTNGGGVMSHPAIVAREYGIPAVVGTGAATSILRDGMKIRLDGGSGSITILEE